MAAGPRPGRIAAFESRDSNRKSQNRESRIAESRDSTATKCPPGTPTCVYVHARLGQTGMDIDADKQ
eukprot:6195248-Lingulodinium_polyedra.AAC.1